MCTKGPLDEIKWFVLHKYGSANALSQDINGNKS